MQEVFGKTITVPAGSELVTFTFDDFEPIDDFGAKFAFQLGSFGEEGEVYNIYVDNVEIKEIPNIVLCRCCQWKLYRKDKCMVGF